MVEKQYFETLEQAESFIREHHIKFYHFETPEFLENGVDLVIEYFICEICGEKTPIECEGSEPNTCAMCMPLTDCEN